jgi:hypothetical protein
MVVAYFFQCLHYDKMKVKGGLLPTSWCILQYSFLPKFLHHSWDGIGRTGWCGRCCTEALRPISTFLHNKQINHVTIMEVVASACFLYEGWYRWNPFNGKEKGKPYYQPFLLQHLQEIKYLVHNMHWCYYVIMVFRSRYDICSELCFRIADMIFH